MIKLAPSILAADFRHLEADIQASIAGGADLIHCDVMDGHFVPNISFGPMVVKAVRELTTLPLDTHLMIARPETYVDDFKAAGTDILTVHAETAPHLHRLIKRIQEADMQAGVALNPATPISHLEEIIGEVDLILIMTVDPGFSGQRFIRSAVDKISRLRLLCETLGVNPVIEVDGGVSAENAAELAGAGAEILVAGSSIFSQPDITAAARAIKQAAMRTDVA